MIELTTNTNVKIAPDELGRAFAGSMSDDQAEFLMEAAHICNEYNWCMQSSMIARGIEDRGAVIGFLETLLSHLREA